MKREERIIDLLLKSEPITVIGVAKLLSIPLLEDNEPVDGGELLVRIVERFYQLRPKRQKEIYDLIKKANKVKEK